MARRPAPRRRSPGRGRALPWIGFALAVAGVATWRRLALERDQRSFDARYGSGRVGAGPGPVGDGSPAG